MHTHVQPRAASSCPAWPRAGSGTAGPESPALAPRSSLLPEEMGREHMMTRAVGVRRGAGVMGISSSLGTQEGFPKEVDILEETRKKAR